MDIDIAMIILLAVGGGRGRGVSSKYVGKSREREESE